MISHGHKIVLQCVAVCCSGSLIVAFSFIGGGCEKESTPDTKCCVAVCCSVLQCVAVCCSVLQRVAVCCSGSLVVASL